MNKVTLFIGLFFSNYHSFSQCLSTLDGNYVSSNIDGVLVIQATTTSWKKEIQNATNAVFTIDSKTMIFKTADSLGFLELGTDKITFITNINSYKLFISLTNNWVAYQSKKNVTGIIVRNLSTGEEQQYSDVVEYLFNIDGKVLLLKTTIKKDNELLTQLRWVYLSEGKTNIIWASHVENEHLYTVGNYAFGAYGNQLAFIVEEKRDSGVTVNSIWHFSDHMQRAELLVNDSLQGIDKELAIGKSPINFSKNGNMLFFYLKENRSVKPNPDFPKLDVWSYTDEMVQSQQLTSVLPRTYAAVISISNHRIIRLENENELQLTSRFLGLIGENEVENSNEKFSLICHFEGNLIREGIERAYIWGENNWNKATISTIYLVSNIDGSRKLLREKYRPIGANSQFYRFSPDGKYVVYYDEEQKCYFSYDLLTSTRHNLTKSVFVSWALENTEYAPRNFYGVSSSAIINWLKDDDAILVYDHYSDIWLLDLSGKKQPLNITNKYAYRTKIKFVWTGINNGKIILSATNSITHDQGFYSTAMNNTGDPLPLTMGAYNYSFVNESSCKKISFVLRESESTPPGYFYTTDYEKYTPIMSSIQKEKKEKRANREPIIWRTFNGTMSEGLLYKPLNFDPKNKYPVIFTYYENRIGFTINKFETHGNVAGASGELDINYCLSHGYLVCIPDIHYIIGETGQSVFNSVVSAAIYLSKKRFVDSKRMGIEGHSFGGYETNYLVTHTNIFAAACSESGATDLISLYGTEEKDAVGYLYSGSLEAGQMRIGASLWERPDLYIKNSAVFTANKVNTPLLMMANKKDYRIPWSQSLELFTALRRLGKRVWMLQYDNGGHGLGSNDGSVLDFNIRSIQFFDHYLKNAPAPIWMTRGIPARLKGTTLGYEYDSTMNTPGPGLLMDEEVRTPQQKELVKQKATVNNEGRIVDVPNKIQKNKRSLRQK